VIFQGRDGHLFRRYEQPCIPLSDTDSPAKASFLELAWRDPAAARAERAEQKHAYWRALIERRRANLEAAKQALAQAKCAADRFDARAEVAACEAELIAAQQAYAAVRELV